MNIWETLGIEPTTDVKLIRRRYAELVRLYHPEDQPEIYQEIVEAYQKALTYAGLETQDQKIVSKKRVTLKKLLNLKKRRMKSLTLVSTLKT